MNNITLNSSTHKFDFSFFNLTLLFLYTHIYRACLILGQAFFVSSIFLVLCVEVELMVCLSLFVYDSGFVDGFACNFRMKVRQYKQKTGFVPTKVLKIRFNFINKN